MCIYVYLYRCCPTSLIELVDLIQLRACAPRSGPSLDPASTSFDEARPTQPRRAPARFDRASLDELRRGSIDPASTSPGEARSTRPRRAPARLGRASLNELRRGSVEPASTSSGEARSIRSQRASSRFDRANRRPLMTLDQQGFDGPRCSKTFSLSIMSSSFVP